MTNPISLKGNLVANFVGRIFASFSVYLFVPFYIQILGNEAYGLVGFFASLQTLFFVIDFGLSGSFTREVARLSASREEADSLHSLARTFIWIFYAIGALAAAATLLLAKPIAVYWVQNQALSQEAIVYSVMLMGVAIGLQFPFVIFQGGLFGLQRQVSLNILLVAMGLLRGFGGLWVLQFIQPSIVIYFVWQVGVNLLQLLIIRFIFARSLPAPEEAPRFHLDYVRRLSGFAATVAIATLLATALLQLDKLYLSKLLPLDEFGAYSLSSTAASLPFLLAGTFFNVGYPRLTQLLAAGDRREFTTAFHLFSQGLAAVAITVGVMIAAFPREVLLVWTANSPLADETWRLLQMQAVGGMFLALTYMAYTVQLAAGKPKYTLIFNSIALAILLPGLWFAIQAFGAYGAALAWTITNAVNALFWSAYILQRLAPDLLRRWLLTDTLLPLAVISATVIVLHALLSPLSESRSEQFIVLALITLLAFAAGVAALPDLRHPVLSTLIRFAARSARSAQKDI